MGSSASLVVALLGAVKRYFALEDFDVHAHCQVLNASIQNKVGSGFDIAAALNGTQLYKRFTNLKKMADAIGGGDDLSSHIKKFVDTFDYVKNPYKLPSNVELAVVDVASGSDTRVMVKQILEWSRSEASTGKQLEDPYFLKLNQLYGEVATALQQGDCEKLRDLCW